MSDVSTDPDTFRPELSLVPARPGVYLFKDRNSAVLYVGKARCLRKRLASYCRAAVEQPVKTQAMLRKAVGLDTLCTATEKEALLLEASLIKKHRPRYNVVLRDDKQYVLFRLDKNSDYPRLTLTRRVQRDGSVYFGPFTSAQAARETWKAILHIFPLRRCTDAAFRNRVRPCLYHHLKLCLAPCVLDVPKEDYARLVSRVELLLSGRSGELTRALEEEMRRASDALEFEQAAVLRDQLRAVRATLERQSAVLGMDGEFDVLGVAPVADGLALGLLFVRQGRLLDRKTFFWPGLGLEHACEVLEHFLAQYYGPGRFIPERIILPWEAGEYAVDAGQALAGGGPLPEDAPQPEASGHPDALEAFETGSPDVEEPDERYAIALLAQILSERRGAAVRLTPPRNAAERRLVDIAAVNARESAGERERSPILRTLETLGQALQLAGPPLRIEAVDISHTAGRQTRAGLVVFEHGEPRKADYRVYAMGEEVAPGDDYAALGAWASRRLAAGPPWPDLLLVDGGKGQLAAVERIFARDGSTPCPLAAIAKARSETGGQGAPRRRTHDLDDVIYLPGRKNPAPLKPGSPELLFLQRVRDTVHAFVIGRHRQSREREALTGELLRLPGVGHKTARALWERFQSLEAMTRATLAELESIPGLGKRRAAALHDRLRQLV